MSLKDIAAVEPLADGASNRHQFAKVGAHGLEAPTWGLRLRSTNLETHGIKDGAVLGGDAHHGDTMHRRAAAPVAAQCDDDVAAVGIAALWLVVRPVDVQPHFFQQPFGGYQRVERAEYPLQRAGIVHETMAGLALAWNEGAGG